MAAKVAGATSGSSRWASITLVRSIDQRRRYCYEVYIDSLVRIYDDIRMKGLRDKAVVLMPWNLRDYDSHKHNPT